MNIYDNFQMKQKILKSYLYDRMDKALKVIKRKDYKEHLIGVINSLEFIDEGVQLRMRKTKENILYLEKRKEIFLKEEFEEILKIKERLDSKMEDVEDIENNRIKDYKRNIDNINFEKQDYENVLYLIHEDDEYFLSYLSLYENYIYEIEGKLSKIIFSKWDDEITDISTYEDNSPFRFLVHAIDCDPEVAISKAKSCNKIATSFITHINTNTYQNREYGFIYYPNNENVILADSSDFYADELSFLDKYPGISAEYISLNSYLNYSKIAACRTYLIEQLEDKSNNGIKEYNEIVLHNNEKTNPIGVFVKKNANETYSRYAYELSKRTNLRLIEIG